MEKHADRFQLKALWKRLWLRGVHYRDRHRNLNALYALEDPWNLDTAAERFRYAETNRILRGEFGTVDRLLEIGCGEGLQSRFLLQICGALHGVDVSRRAVERARSLVPATFAQADIRMELSNLGPVPGFDLVTAFEVLYYVQHPRAFVERMCSLGRACAVSYHEPQRAILDRVFADIRIDGRIEIVHDSMSWSLLWWRNR